MLEILRDQVWEFVGGVFLGLVAIIVTIILWLTQRRRKALSYEIISHTPLLSVGDEVEGKLQILFNGNPVQNAHLVVLKIINSGNVPITSTDYERPISLDLGEGAQILTAEVSETNPDDLQGLAKIEKSVTGPSKIVLEPVLLNGGDSITLKLLVNELGEIAVSGRIVGVKDIRKFGARRVGFWPIARIVGILFLLIEFPLMITGLILSYPGSPYGDLADLLYNLGLIPLLGMVVIGGMALLFTLFVSEFKKLLPHR